MRAVLTLAPKQPLVVEQVEPLPLGPRDVLVRVGASGVCHSDVSATSTTGLIPFPSIVGHEGAGTVEEVGSLVTRVKPGDKVVTSFAPSCGQCAMCVRGKSNLCEYTPQLIGRPRARRRAGDEVSGFGGLGTMAEAMVVDEASAVRVDTELPFEQLALIGCGVTTGIGAVINTAQMPLGATVAVVGCGGVGQSVVQGARAAGAARIIAVDTVALKRTMAEGFGATDSVDPEAGDPVEQVLELTGGKGVEFAFEVIGNPETQVQVVKMTRRGGTAVLVGTASRDAVLPLPVHFFRNGERRLLASQYGSSNVRLDFQRIVDLAQLGRIDLGAMVSRRIGLDDVNEAFAAMEQGQVIRSVIVM